MVGVLSWTRGNGAVITAAHAKRYRVTFPLWHDGPVAAMNAWSPTTIVFDASGSAIAWARGDYHLGNPALHTFLASLAGADGVARAADWLIGSWSGTIGEWRGKNSAERFMNVTSVAADGAATGTWSTAPEGRAKAKVSVQGDHVTVITSANSHVALKRENDRLVGTFRLEKGTTTHSIELFRAPNAAAPRPPAGRREEPVEGRRWGDTFVGLIQAHSAERCVAGSAEMYVTVEGGEVSGYWTSPGGDLMFTAPLAGETFTVVVTTPRGEQFDIQGRRRGHALEASLNSVATGCRLAGTLVRKQ